MLNKDNNAHIDGSGNIVIQDANNTTITINTSNKEEIRKFLIDFQQKLDKLPLDILNILMKNNVLDTELNIGANIYFSIYHLMSTTGEKGVSLGVTITNLSKEIRYFNQPYFKVSPAFKLEKGLEHDTFMMPLNEKITFPVRLEYGQVLNITYPIAPSQFSLFKNNAPEHGYMEVFCGTTVGELYNSNKQMLQKIVNIYQSTLK